MAVIGRAGRAGVGRKRGRDVVGSHGGDRRGASDAGRRSEPWPEIPGPVAAWSTLTSPDLRTSIRNITRAGRCNVDAAFLRRFGFRFRPSCRREAPWSPEGEPGRLAYRPDFDPFARCSLSVPYFEWVGCYDQKYDYEVVPGPLQFAIMESTS